ncbi:aminoglycoside phosphotransferase family protein [Legionella septentrionalis]|uniref:aminoglycoside phosphotransferase family protein n=1 Tax=Legionella septentrionalis TaxID=2498109 RepID=UPI000F8E2913|nr:aminoglycoside phosphotransferase family protein [Legionella septentrionalis]RUQ99351.1 aminoglycoside phosphotransferase [Legionella septentrionalis]
MREFEQNIMNLFGSQGKSWLQALPATLKKLATEWKLSDLKPLSNLSYNFVVKAMHGQQLPVVLKLSCDATSTRNEVKALQHFQGHGCIKLLKINWQHHAILLEQAIPGQTLKTHYPLQFSEAVNAYASVVETLLHKPTISQRFPMVHDWLKALDEACNSHIPNSLLLQAIALKNDLLNSPESYFVLHGDLHHDNILMHKGQWVAIDPKGIVGEKAFEAAAFDFITRAELANKADVKDILQMRIHILANALNLSPVRLTQWIFVRLILAAAWFAEDKGDPSYPLILARILRPLL